MPFMVVHGNHDVGPYFGKVFSTPRDRFYYSFDYRFVHFIVLDTEDAAGPASDQGKWLGEDLAACAGRPFTIVFHHKPLISSGDYCFFSNEQYYADLNRIFLDNGVDLSFSGHEHFYERLRENGLAYIVAGGAGQELRDRVTVNPASIVFRKTFHFCLVRAFPDMLAVETYDEGGNLIDNFRVDPR